MKTIFSKFKILIDFVSKNVERVKTIGSILLLVLFLLSLGGNGCQRNKAVQLAKRFVELDFKNLLLQKDLSISDSINVVSRFEIDSLGKEVIFWKNKAIVLEDSESAIRHDLRALKDSLLNIPSDTSYAFLQRAYPYPGEYKYPFNEPQVKNIHLDYLENNELWLLNENLMSQVDNCKSVLAIQDKIVLKQNSEAISFSKQKSTYKEIIKNNEEEKELLRDQRDDAEGKTTIWKVLTGIATVVALVIAL